MASEDANRTSSRLSSFSVYDDPPVTNASLIKRQLDLELQLKDCIGELIKAYLDTDSLSKIEELTEHQLSCCGRISGHRLQLRRLRRSQSLPNYQCDVEDPVELPQESLHLLSPDSTMDLTVEEVSTSENVVEAIPINNTVTDTQLNDVNDLLTDDAIEVELTEMIETVVNKAIMNAVVQLSEQKPRTPNIFPTSSVDSCHERNSEKEKNIIEDAIEVNPIVENLSNDDHTSEANITASLDIHSPVDVCNEGNGGKENDFINVKTTVKNESHDHITEDEASRKVTETTNNGVSGEKDTIISPETPPSPIKEMSTKYKELSPEPPTNAQDVAGALKPITEEPVAMENTSVQSEHNKATEAKALKEDPVSTELISDPIKELATECPPDNIKSDTALSTSSSAEVIQSASSSVVEEPGLHVPEKLVKSDNAKNSSLAATSPAKGVHKTGLEKGLHHADSSPTFSFTAHKKSPKSQTLDFHTSSANQKSKYPNTLGRGKHDLMASAKVTPLGMISTFEWDPTCLLEELYIDCKPVSPPGVQPSRLIVEMEKLPRNQVKKTIAKGWKKRYFCITSGSLYYYEDKKMAKALGVVKLNGARVVREDSVIKVTDKLNQTIAIRGKPDDTYRMYRSLHLESIHPTLTSVITPYPGNGHPVIIVDIGSCSVRAGFAQEEAYPRLFFPAVCSVVKDTDEIQSCGLDALTPTARQNCEIVFPTRQKLRMDQETSVPIRYVHFFLLHIFKELKVEPSSAKVIMTLPQNYTEKDKELLMEVLLENLSCEAACLLDQSILALYSYGATSGIVVDIGDRTDIVPIVDGYKIESGVTKLKIGGATVTEYLKRLSTEHGLRYFSDVEFYITRLIKEKIGFVSQDFGTDMERCEVDAASYKRALEVVQYQLPDRKTLIAMDSTLFRASEGFFLPSLWGKDIPSIPDSVWKAIQACDIDRRKEMSRSIFLSGGATLATGFQERLEKELTTIAPSAYTIQVQASVSRHHAAFLGAAVLASLDSFQDSWITKEDFVRLKM